MWYRSYFIQKRQANIKVHDSEWEGAISLRQAHSICCLKTPNAE